MLKIAPRSQSTHLPVELWTEIISYLPRYNLKRLLIFQPHPLGKIASHIYFSTLSIHLGAFRSQLLYYNRYRSWCESTDEFVKGRDELIKWHNKRSRDILTTIVESDFGNRIQKLKIYAGSDDQTDTLAFQIGAVCPLGFKMCHSFQFADLLVSALPKLTRLKILECNGLIPLFTAIASSLVTLPRLKTLRLRYVLRSQLSFTIKGELTLTF
jgi:hypothetical protein